MTEGFLASVAPVSCDATRLSVALLHLSHPQPATLLAHANFASLCSGSPEDLFPTPVVSRMTKCSTYNHAFPFEIFFVVAVVAATELLHSVVWGAASTLSITPARSTLLVQLVALRLAHLGRVLMGV